MEKLFEVLLKRYEKKLNSMLVGIVESHGSSPRKKDAFMIVGADGRVYGSIGGGNLEYQSILFAQELLKTKSSHIENFDLSNRKSARLGMVCGGNVRVVFAFIDYTDVNIRNELEKVIYSEENKIPYDFRVKIDGRSEFIIKKDKYDGKVYIFGGGHLGIETSNLLNHLGFSCQVLDDREEFLDRNNFHENIFIGEVDFENLDQYLKIQKEDYICIMTRGHVMDYEVEKFALKTDAKYIGVVGSKRKIAFVNDKLKKDGFSDDDIKRIVTPIGLDIKAETPEEIAVSIAAQLIKIRVERI
ncbi:MAG: XdhC/CoxI family protein [Lachnospiraceae bacterium]|jgi:xanthine dehydrogenase accessory factor|nr:XdhC/CoxI family protein [Lachnospiraceae bacterium]